MSGYNVDFEGDGGRSSWGMLRGEERIAREDEERRRYLAEEMAKKEPSPQRSRPTYSHALKKGPRLPRSGR